MAALDTIFRLPGVFTAWALGNKDATPEQLVDHAADAGFKWIAQQFGSPDGRPDPDPALVARMRSQCHLRSVFFGMWEVKPRTLDRLNAVKPNFWIPNVETDYAPGSSTAWFNYAPLLHEFRTVHPHLPAGVVTDCGLSAQAFIRANVKALPECYAGCPDANPDTTVENMVRRCREMGWKVVFPVLGVYGDEPKHGALERFRAEVEGQRSDPVKYGQGWSCYLLDEMLDADFASAKSFTAN